MTGLTLDAGALVGVERRSARMAALLVRARERGMQIRVPAPVLAQVFRGGPRQAQLERMLGHSHTGIVSFTEPDARTVGRLLAVTDSSDVVDASVVVCAWQNGDGVVTSDPDDLHRLDPRLTLMVL